MTSEGREFEFRSKVLGVYDKGKAGTVVRSVDVLVDATTGEEYARNIGSLFYVGQGNWGGPRGPPSQKRPAPPSQRPDLSFELDIDEQAAHLYRYDAPLKLPFAFSVTLTLCRLNGDYNPLHATPEYGQQMGYGGIIMHGVYAYNRIAHDLVRKLGGGDPSTFREMSARFAGPVKPGDKIRVELWKTGTTQDGHDDLRWTAVVVGTGKACLTDGRAEIRSSRVQSRI